MRTVTSPAGRFARPRRSATPRRGCCWPRTRPAGPRRCRWPPPTTVVLAIDSAAADGRDVSWLWDVDYEQLAGRTVVATGPRAQDLAVRLLYAGVEHRCVPDLAAALRRASRAGGRDRDVHAVPAAAEDGWGVMAADCRCGRCTSRDRADLSVAARHLRRPGQRERAGEAAGVARLRRRCSTVVEPGDPLPDTGHVYLLGGGEDAAQITAVRELQRRRRPAPGPRPRGGGVRRLRGIPDRRQLVHRRRSRRGDRRTGAAGRDHDPRAGPRGRGDPDPLARPRPATRR